MRSSVEMHLKAVRCCVCGQWAHGVEILYDPCFEAFFCTECFEPDYCECEAHERTAA